MTLFLKNLPKSFFRSVVSKSPVSATATFMGHLQVSSRPVFDKTTLLSASLCMNAPILAPKTNQRGDKKKTVARNYHLYHHKHQTKKTKNFGKLPNAFKGPVDYLKRGIVESTINCDELSGGVKLQSSSDETRMRNEAKEKREEEVRGPSPRKNFFPKYQKAENETRRIDVKALAGTWLSQKSIKFDFNSCEKPKPDATTKPIKLESPGASRLYVSCKKVSSREVAAKAITGSTASKKEPKTRNFSVKREESGDPCPEADEPPEKDKKKKQGKPSSKGKAAESCIPCTPKKPKKTSKKGKSSKPTDEEITEGTNTSLLIDTCDKQDMQSKELIAKLKKELEECRRNQQKSQEKQKPQGSVCVESPNLDGHLPKEKIQSKSVVSGSKSLLQSVCAGLSKKKAPKKSKSAPVVKKKKKKKKEVKESKSAVLPPTKKGTEEKKRARSEETCKIDLDPEYCKKSTTKKKSGREQKKSAERGKKSKADVCKKSSTKKKGKKDRSRKKSAGSEQKSETHLVLEVCKKSDTKKDEKKGRSGKKSAGSEKKSETDLVPEVCKKSATKKGKSEKEDKQANRKCPKFEFKSPEAKKGGAKAEKSTSKKVPKDQEKKPEEDKDGLKDQSPIKQCIEACKKKDKKTEVKKGKSKDEQRPDDYAKKVAEYKRKICMTTTKEEKKAEPEPKERCGSAPKSRSPGAPKAKKARPKTSKKTDEAAQKDEEGIKPFVPCQYEAIKPGIRSADEEEAPKKGVQIEDPEEDASDKADYEVVEADPHCRKFEFKCPRAESTKKGTATGEKKEIVVCKKSEDKPKKPSPVEKKNQEVVAKSERKDQKAIYKKPLPPCPYTELERALEATQKRPLPSSESRCEEQKTDTKLKRSETFVKKLRIPIDQSPLMQCVATCGEKKKLIPEKGTKTCSEDPKELKQVTELHECERMERSEKAKPVSFPTKKKKFATSSSKKEREVGTPERVKIGDQKVQVKKKTYRKPKIKKNRKRTKKGGTSKPEGEPNPNKEGRKKKERRTSEECRDFATDTKNKLRSYVLCESKEMKPEKPKAEEEIRRNSEDSVRNKKQVAVYKFSSKATTRLGAREKHMSESIHEESSKKKEEISSRIFVSAQEEQDRAFQLSKAVNTSLTIGAFDKQNDLAQKALEAIIELKKEMVELRKQKSPEIQPPPPKLDTPLPETPEQQKGFIGGSLSFFKSISAALFSERAKKEPRKYKSQDLVCKKSGKALKKSKSSEAETPAKKEDQKAEQAPVYKKPLPPCEYAEVKRKSSPLASSEEREDQKAACTEEQLRLHPDRMVDLKQKNEDVGRKKKRGTVKSSRYKTYPELERVANREREVRRKEAATKKKTAVVEESSKKVEEKPGLKLSVTCSHKTEKIGTKPRSPAVQNPIMQCIALCQKKRKDLQGGKSQAPRPETVHRKSVVSEPDLCKSSPNLSKKEESEDKSSLMAPSKSPVTKRPKPKIQVHPALKKKGTQKKIVVCPEPKKEEKKAPKPERVCKPDGPSDIKKEEKGRMKHMITCSDPATCTHHERGHREICEEEEENKKVKEKSSCQIFKERIKSFVAVKKSVSLPAALPVKEGKQGKKAQSSEEETCDEEKEEKPQKVKKLVEFYEMKKDEARKLQGAMKRIVPSEDVKGKVFNKSEEIKEFVPCKYEEIKPGIRPPDDVGPKDEERKKKNETTEIVICESEERENKEIKIEDTSDDKDDDEKTQLEETHHQGKRVMKFAFNEELCKMFEERYPKKKGTAQKKREVRPCKKAEETEENKKKSKQEEDKDEIYKKGMKKSEQFVSEAVNPCRKESEKAKDEVKKFGEKTKKEEALARLLKRCESVVDEEKSKKSEQRFVLEVDPCRRIKETMKKVKDEVKKYEEKVKKEEAAEQEVGRSELEVDEDTPKNETNEEELKKPKEHVALEIDPCRRIKETEKAVKNEVKEYTEKTKKEEATEHELERSELEADKDTQKELKKPKEHMASDIDPCRRIKETEGVEENEEKTKKEAAAEQELELSELEPDEDTQNNVTDEELKKSEEHYVLEVDPCRRIKEIEKREPKNEDQKLRRKCEEEAVENCGEEPCCFWEIYVQRCVAERKKNKKDD